MMPTTRIGLGVRLAPIGTVSIVVVTDSSVVVQPSTVVVLGTVVTGPGRPVVTAR